MYNLDQTDLNTLLSKNVSGPTKSLIDAALTDSGNYPTGNLILPLVVEDDSSPTNQPTTVNLNLGAGAFGEPIGLYLETGSNVTLNVDTPSPHGSVIATGDGDNVVLNDIYGGDTLVGGAGHDTLIGGPNSTLIAGGGPTQLEDSIGEDTFFGGTGPDTIDVSGVDDTIYGGSGPETINLAGSGSALFAGSGSESITLDKFSHDTIYLGQGPGQSTDSVTVRGGADSIYVGSAGGVDTINTESIAADSVDLYVSASQSNTHVTETDPSTNTYQVTYGSGATATSVTVEGANVTLHFNNGVPGAGTQNI